MVGPCLCDLCVCVRARACWLDCGLWACGPVDCVAVYAVACVVRHASPCAVCHVAPSVLCRSPVCIFGCFCVCVMCPVGGKAPTRSLHQMASSQWKFFPLAGRLDSDLKMKMDIDEVPPSPKPKCQLEEDTTIAHDDEELYGYAQTAVQKARHTRRNGLAPLIASRARARDRLTVGNDDPAECASSRNAVIGVAPFDAAPSQHPPLYTTVCLRDQQRAGQHATANNERAVRPDYPNTRLINLPQPPTQDKHQKVVPEFDIPDDQDVELFLSQRGKTVT